MEEWPLGALRPISFSGGTPPLSSHLLRSQTIVHQPLETLCGSVMLLTFSFAAHSNLRRLVQRRQLNSSELNVTPMSGDTAATSSRLSGVESGQQGTRNRFYRNPLTPQMGDERWFMVKKSMFHVQSPECTTTVLIR